MPHIEYRGTHDIVDVPAYGLGGVARGVPVEVSAEAAAALTGDGTSTIWVLSPDVTPARAKKES